MTDEFETITVDVQNGVATVRLNRPPVNAIDSAMRRELIQVVDRLREDDIRVGIVTGTDKVFSVGADIALFEEAQSWTTSEFRTNSRILGRSFQELETLEIPVIAAITGTCVGGGLELALACDVRFAAPDAVLGFPEHNIGLIPGLGGCSRFVQLVGPGRAKDLIFTGRLIEGAESKEIGLVEHVAEDPDMAAQEYAIDLLSKPPQAIGIAKRLVSHARDTNLEAMGFMESLAQSTLLETEDHIEGITAFREKRDAEFSGK